MEDKINDLAADLEERDQECRRLQLALRDSVKLTAEQKTTVLCALIGDLRKAQGNYDDFGGAFWAEEERRLREAIAAVAGEEYLEALEEEL